MARACCPDCRLRFTRDFTAYTTICPECRTPLVVSSTAREELGYRLHDITDPVFELPFAAESALPEPDLPAQG